MSPPRTIVLDANVIEQIGRGNADAANALRQLRNTPGVRILVTQQAYTEMAVKPDIPRTAAAKREFLREMNIQIAPAGDAAVRQQVLDANITRRGGTILGPGDIQVAAEARAINAEVWSFDKAYRNNPNSIRQTLGVSVAPECGLPLAPNGHPEDYRVARKLAGLAEVEIDLHGNVTRPGEGGAGASAKPSPRPPEGGTGALPKPSTPHGPGTIRARLSSAGKAFRMGIRSALSAENIASLIPDVILAVADRVAARDALRKIQVKFLKEGFAKGVAAGLMGWNEKELEYLKHGVTAFRLRNMGDPAGYLKLSGMYQLAQNCESYGVDVGYYFVYRNTEEWQKNMRAKGFQALSDYGYTFTGDDLYEATFIDKLAWVLGSTTNPIIEPAIRFK